ncbi:MAG: hypothetical protein K8F54_01760 [Altibacter sp.]|uniref:hypothetical protein n=1 Tax=Altibacter sp. TaxID=2024823 RepID=UPI001E18F04F|nr:hypothetical protein [Altibacter sp.]MBZ0326306.1 hypothetical protein [Altibacter sp.]
MKKIFLCMFVHCCVLTGSSQEQEPPMLLVVDSTWTKEIFHFPIGFAQTLTYSGYEEAHFPPGWGDRESPQFWSYAFAWYIDASSSLTASQLEQDLQKYFDGLMQAVNKEKGKQIPPSTSLLTATEIKDDTALFEGTVHTHDSFRSRAMMSLQVRIEQQFCRATQKALLVFRFSPQAFDRAIWEELHKIRPLIELCE